MADAKISPQATYVAQHQENLDTIPQAMSDILTAYSHIPKEEQVAHVFKVRDQAYKKFPYPCIGDLCFLDLSLSVHHAYKDHILAPLKGPSVDGEPEPLFLDLGSCFGQDVRELAHEGALVHRLWASDIEAELINFGFQMFNDEDKISRDHFLCPGDLLTDSPDDRLKVLDDKVTILNVTAVFHLFSLKDQKKIAHRCLRLMRKNSTTPVLIVGGQVGNKTTRYVQCQDGPQEDWRKHRHNEQSWRELWNEVSRNPEWKDKVKALEVKTAEGQGEAIPHTMLTASKEHNENFWLTFEIWLTFA